jgi:hypothetical protein
MAILPLVGSLVGEHSRVMAVLLVLIALWLLIAVSEWRGWVTDTRDGADWMTREEVRGRRLHW